jgi:aldose 1-epimerase
MTFQVQTLVLENSALIAKFTNYGATLTHLIVKKDIHGKQRDIVLGFDDPLDYRQIGQNQNPYFGCIVGRTCNR